MLMCACMREKESERDSVGKGGGIDVFVVLHNPHRL